MTCKEAQQIAERFANFHSMNITLADLRQALVVLANFYEDNRFDKSRKLYTLEEFLDAIS